MSRACCARRVSGREWYHRYIDALCDGELAQTEADRKLLEALGPRVRLYRQRTEAFGAHFGKRSGRELAIAEIAAIAAERLKAVNRGDAAEDVVLGSVGRMLQAVGLAPREDWVAHVQERIQSQATPDGQTWVSAFGGPTKAARELVSMLLSGEPSAGTIERIQRESSADDRRRVLNAALDPELMRDDVQRIIDEERILHAQVEDGRVTGFVPAEEYERRQAGEVAKNTYKRPHRAGGRES